jgi:phenylpropionate dioxygenase-like ring-hydroxylating dioxygenase large terminal subunit
MSFPQNSWYAAGWSSELSGGILGRTFLGKPVVLFRDSAGIAHALADRCPHRFAPLHRGRLKDGIIECGYHGLCFDAAGTCVKNPHGDQTIPRKAVVQSYKMVERQGILWIWMGEPSLADPDKIRDFPQFGATRDYTSVGGYLYVKSNYQLISDNLLDLTHGQYLHPMFTNSAGPPAFQPYDDPDQTTVWAKFDRKSQYPNKYLQFLGYPADKLGDHRNYMRWNAPAVMLLDVGMTSVGGRHEDGISIPTAHLLTPETEFTTHYFWAMARNFRLEDKPFSEQMLKIGTDIFNNEDKPMIEAQQRTMGDVTDLLSLRPVLLATDGPSVRARRIVLRLLEEEETANLRVAS